MTPREEERAEGKEAKNRREERRSGKENKKVQRMKQGTAVDFDFFTFVLVSFYS